MKKKVGKKEKGDLGVRQEEEELQSLHHGWYEICGVSSLIQSLNAKEKLNID